LLGYFQELPYLFWRQWLYLMPLGTRCVNGIGGIAGDEIPAKGLL